MPRQPLGKASEIRSHRVKVLVPTSSRFLRPRNTDWRYAARTLPSLSKYCPDMEIVTQRSLFADAEINLRWSLGLARNNGFSFLPPQWAYALEQDCPLYASDIERANPDVLLSYERYPARAFGVPVVWAASPSYPEVLTASGMTAQFVDRLMSWKRSRAQLASRLVFTTEVSLNNFVQQCGESLRAKSHVIPFFIPGLPPLSDLAKKWNQPTLRFLFVGREANRKGLPAALAAVMPLLQGHQDSSLTIVSSFDDGPVPIPSLPNITVYRETGRQEVLQLMADSHVLVMPSSWESYGFVYIEAMSQGCLPLAVDRPIQREIIGDHGILVPSQQPEAITVALTRVTAQRDLFFQKAVAGQLNFLKKHSPGVIAAQFQAVCQAASLRHGQPVVVSPVWQGEDSSCRPYGEASPN